MSLTPPPVDPQEDPAPFRRQRETLRALLASTRNMIDAISEAVYVQAADGRFLDVNEGVVRMYGYDKAFFMGQTPALLSAPGKNDLGLVGHLFQKALAGEPQEFEFWGRRKNGEIFPKVVHLYPGDYLGQPVVIAIGQDITVRKRAELVQQATYHIAEAALSARNTRELFPKIHAIVRDLMPADNIYFALWDRATDTVSFPYWVDEVDPAPEPRTLRHGLTEFILQSGKPLLVDTATLLEMEAAGEVEPLGAIAMDWLGVPLRGESGVLGALVVQSYKGGTHYTAADRDLLAFVSGQVALALERTRAQSEQRILATTMDRAVDPVFGMDRSGRFVFVNQAACTSLGYDRDTLLQMSIWEVDPTVSEDQWPDRWNRVTVTGMNRTETRHRRADGTEFPVDISSSFISSEGREVVFTHVRDITSRMAAEASLRASEARFSAAFLASPDAILITRMDGTFVEVNDTFLRMTGWSREEVIGRTTMDIRVWADASDRERMQQMIRAKGHFIDIESPFRIKDGSIKTGILSGALVTINGELCLLTVTRDITERKAAEVALRNSEQRFRTVLAHSEAVIYQLDTTGKFLLSEGLGLANLGLTPGQVVGLNALDVYRDDPETTAQIRDGMEGKGSRRVIHAAGRIFDSFITPVFDENGALESLIGIATDITERQQIEDALREERGLFVGGPVMVIRWQSTSPWLVDYISPNVQAILGYAPEDLISGRIRFDDLVHPDDRERIHREAQVLRTSGVGHYEQEYRIRNASGQYRWIHDFTAFANRDPDIRFYLGYMLDITERRQAEEALGQTQKLESLGLLAGGIAHDFNNLLTVVMGNLNLAQMHLPEGAKPAQYLAKMEATVLRATELTKQLLAYSGRGHFLVKPQDLNKVVDEVAHLLEVSISKKVHLHFDLDPELPAIQADAAQIQQVVMNLVTNASDAIGDQEGTIRLTTTTATLGEHELRQHFTGNARVPGRYVLLEVADSGCGIPDEVMARIFDPFFTTKAAGRGLGLSAMLGILRGHNAGMSIHSEVGQGSRFRICFPASESIPDEATQRWSEEAFRDLKAHVLLVDDEDLVLQTIGAALESLGLTVATARDGVEAVEAFRAATPRPDLVIMDLTMPRMDGREAFQAMHQLDASVPVLLSSGFTQQDSLETESGHGPAGFIQKPYQIKELRRMLQRLLKN